MVFGRIKSNKVVNFKKSEKRIPELNIGTVGHVDHGKTSLVHALTGKLTDTHSEELKRGITIRLGYADTTFYYCSKCKSYSVSGKCPKCFGDADPKRTVSFVDAPGHETLMATVLSGAVLMNGALLLISATEKCPQPQTSEHLKALEIVGIKNIIIVQNKIDLVTSERAKKSYEEVKKFVKNTIAENAPVIPISALHNANIDVLIKAIEEYIPTPELDIKKDPKFFVARSFDINKPGTPVKDLKGGVIGGSLVSGVLKKGDEIEIKPGVKVKNTWMPLEAKIIEINQSATKIKEAKPGGLLAIQTDLDPSMEKSDGLAGNIAGLKGSLPPAQEELKFKPNLFDHIIGVESDQKVGKIKTGDVLMLTVAITKTVGVVVSGSESAVHIKLKIPVPAEKDEKISISKQVGGRWHLIGWGQVL
jgi:translation initiation factor 2 subunit 3